MSLRFSKNFNIESYDLKENQFLNRQVRNLIPLIFEILFNDSVIDPKKIAVII